MLFYKRSVCSCFGFFVILRVEHFPRQTLRVWKFWKHYKNHWRFEIFKKNLECQIRSSGGVHSSFKLILPIFWTGTNDAEAVDPNCCGAPWTGSCRCWSSSSRRPCPVPAAPISEGATFLISFIPKKYLKIMDDSVLLYWLYVSKIFRGLNYFLCLGYSSGFFMNCRVFKS